MIKKRCPRSKFENCLLTRTVCPRRLSFSQFVVLMSTLNGQRDNLLGQMVLAKRQFSNFDRGHLFLITLYKCSLIRNCLLLSRGMYRAFQKKGSWETKTVNTSYSETLLIYRMDQKNVSLLQKFFLDMSYSETTNL